MGLTTIVPNGFEPVGHRISLRGREGHSSRMQGGPQVASHSRGVQATLSGRVSPDGDDPTVNQVDEVTNAKMRSRPRPQRSRYIIRGDFTRRRPRNGKPGRRSHRCKGGVCWLKTGRHHSPHLLVAQTHVKGHQHERKGTQQRDHELEYVQDVVKAEDN